MASPSENPLKRFIGEIHRRSLWQVLGIYLVASWAVLQVVDTLEGMVTLPEWFAGYVAQNFRGRRSRLRAAWVRRDRVDSVRGWITPDLHRAIRCGPPLREHERRFRQRVLL